jgi:hypothetical protein
MTMKAIRLPTQPARVFLLFFALALVVRLAAIAATGSMTRWIDTDIYLDGADLLRNGVNPYDFSDAPELRDSLRRDSFAYNDYTGSDQERWNYYAASNLPLSLIVYGAISTVAFSHIGFRIAFAVFDSVLAGVIALFILRFWGGGWTRFSVLAALGLGALSPVLLKWGTMYAEDKGLEVLLMLGALYLARSPSRGRALYLSAFVAGCSIAFKLFGAFIIPLCVKYAVYDRVDTQPSNRARDALIYLGVVAAGTAIWFLPFLPAVVSTMLGRFGASTGSVAAGHASPWVFVSRAAPGLWLTIRLVTLVVVAAAVGVGFFRRRLTLELVCASAMIWFACLVLTAGSMDRLNMALTTGLLISVPQTGRWGRWLVVLFCAAGLLPLLHIKWYYILPNATFMRRPPWNDYEMSDALFATLVTLAFFAAVSARLSTTTARDVPART